MTVPAQPRRTAAEQFKLAEAGRKSWATRRLRDKNPPPPKRKPKIVPIAPIKMPKTEGTVSAKEMMLRTVVLLVTINGIGNYRKVDTASLNITDAVTDDDVNKDWFGVHKKLMIAPELKNITSIGNKAKSYVFSRALPYSLKSGIYLLPRTFEQEMDEKLTGFEKEMGPYINSLANNLSKYKAEAKREQGPLFNEKQWPTADKIRNSFRISWRFLRIDSADGLSKEVHDREVKKAEAEWAETRDLVRQVQRAEFYEKVKHFVERLTPGADGKRKIFREGSMENFEEFLTTYNPRDITNDVKMKVLVDQAKSLLHGVDVEAIKEHEDFRDHIRHGFEAIQKILDPMVIVKPSRRITFAEDES